MALLALPMLLVACGSEQAHFDREETLLAVSAPPAASVHLFRAGNQLRDATEIDFPDSHQVWLRKGRYFLKVADAGQTMYYPVVVLGFQAGPDRDGTLAITIRPVRLSYPQDFAYVPSGYVLLGDSANPQEQHYVWVSAFAISTFEVTNLQFSKFLSDHDGFANPRNWTKQGQLWLASNHSEASVLRSPEDPDSRRFAQPEQPVTRVTWFEANAYCRWLTSREGAGKWRFVLPNDAEWEKAARGPDGFDYGLGMRISDEQVGLYNWRKNPGVPVTVVDRSATRAAFQPNRYGIYHMSGNVAEWTQSAFREYSRRQPFADDERNNDDTAERRTVRGGSWYSATTAPIYLPYRDGFQPEHRADDVGFRVIARLTP
jgi:formylglycine-generating enzyme required for sulfatase activity